MNMVAVPLFVACVFMSLAWFPVIIRILTELGRWDTNYRGDEIPTSTGVLFLPVLVFAEAGLYLVWPHVFEPGAMPFKLNMAFIALVIGLALLGLLDDVYGGAQARGFGGHIKALLKGTVTTGIIKALGGGLLALAVSWWIGGAISWKIILDGLIIALSINVFNLLDLRPGRSLKVFLIVTIALLVATFTNDVWVFAVIVLGPALILFKYDLKAQVMLGDAGSNVLGGVIGFIIVAALGLTPKIVVAVILVALNIISEKWSFSKIIESIAPLRWFDQLGRLP